MICNLANLDQLLLPWPLTWSLYSVACINVALQLVDWFHVVKYAKAFGANVTSHGKLVLVGAPDKPLELPVFPLLQGRKLVAGSAIGGLKETQEMIDFSC
ncbi:hypothetical protein KIW84_070980 [Lathyrus oleraceus]|uniref:Uncharacterized protein n=1 Tax=Pisum sativum TaxID=3888 RepID=A0A9D4ZT12_PEA|nr:hypothetical protein KIW84_070980 [Pisum sativum]